jgi:hypothetical protein
VKKSEIQPALMRVKIMNYKNNLTSFEKINNKNQKMKHLNNYSLKTTVSRQTVPVQINKIVIFKKRIK